MAIHPQTTACLKAAQSYLEAEFLGQIEAASETEITVSHDDVRHHLVQQPEFLKQCSNYAYAFHESELADYIRESRPLGRRFLVVWHEGGTRVRLRARLRSLDQRRESPAARRPVMKWQTLKIGLWSAAGVGLGPGTSLR